MNLQVLFVDDEALVLEALKRSLRPQAKDWKIHFSTAVNDAWEVLHEHPIDVVVSDMQMLGSDGAAFLLDVREAMPHTVRLILSGFRDSSAIIKAPAAHRYLMKPIMVTDLVRQITTATKEAPEEVDLRRIINGTACLPSQRHVVDELSATLADPKAVLDDVAKIAEKDLALSAKFIQLGNSGVCGHKRAGANLNASVHAIGIESLRLIVDNTEFVKTYDDNDQRSVRLFDLHTDVFNEIASSDVQDETHRLVIKLKNIGRILGIEHNISWDSVSHSTQTALLGISLLHVWGIPEPIIDLVAAPREVTT